MNRSPWARTGRWVVILGLAACAGCTTIYSYPDPSYGRYELTLGDLRGVPARLQLRTTYVVNDAPNAVSADDVRDRVARLLETRTGIDVIGDAAADAATPSLVVRVEHRYSADAARQSGMLTGLTLGGVERRVRDRFQVHVSLIQPEGGDMPDPEETGIYPQAIVTSLGRSKAQVRQGTYAQALDRVLEHALARFFADRTARREVTDPIIFLPEQQSEDGANR